MRLPAPLRQSVRRKLTALVVTSTLAALTVAALGLIWYTVRDYQVRKMIDVRTQSEIVARASAPAVAFNDAQEAQRDLDLLKVRTGYDQAALYLPDGRLFAAYTRHGIAASGPVPAGPPGTRFEKGYVVLTTPILQEGQTLGTLVVKAQWEVQRRVAAYVLILGTVMAGALAAAILVSSWLQRAVTNPILKVADAARGVVERRDFTVRAGRTTDDEIGVLADAMNRMLVDLESEMTVRREAEEALRVSNRRKDEFLATLAHELRNPLAPIRNAAYLLRARDVDERTTAEARGIIERQVGQMVRLVDDLLDVSRITTGKLTLRREPVDPRVVATAALEGVEPLIRERGHTLSVTLPPPGVTVVADPTRLAQVFMNLLNNAAKFTDPGGRIEFTLEVRDRELVGRVRDTGIGIAPDMIGPIFDMFAQVDRTLERGSLGLGVGLSLSRRLVELHGGTLEAHSDGPGRGAEFVVRMPAVGLEAPASASACGPAPRSDGHDAVRGARPLRVLVVDDNRDFAGSLGNMLRAMGHEVRVEYDGVAGLAAAEAFRPDVAFLDIGMPRLNGYEVAKRLRARPATSSSLLYAVTGWDQPADRQRSRESGFDDHIVKPMDPDRLQGLLGRAGPPA